MLKDTKPDAWKNSRVSKRTNLSEYYMGLEFSTNILITFVHFRFANLDNCSFSGILKLQFKLLSP